MDFGEVLSRAGRIVWRFKVLWIFGIFAGCVNGSGGGGGNGARYTTDAPFDFPNFRFEDALPFIIAAVLVGILLFLLVLALGAIGRIGLVRGAWQADEGAATLTFSGLWQSSGRYFWRVIGLMVLIGLLGLLVVLAIALPVIGTAISAGVIDDRIGVALLPLIPLFICLVCLLVPLSWLVSVLVELAVVSIVGEDVGIGEGLSRSWKVIRSNLGNTILMAIVLGIAQAVAGFVISIPLIALSLPFVFAFMSGSQNVQIAGGVIAAILFIILLPVLIAAGGLIQSYITTAWTLTYRRLTGRPAAGALIPTREVPAS